MKIGILGSAIVGQKLATSFFSEGHDVTLGTRNVNKEEVIKFKTENASIKIATMEDTVMDADIIVLAVSGDVVVDAIKQIGVEKFTNKIIIDCTNPIAKVAPDNGVLKFFTKQNESLMEAIQQTIPNAKVVKAFSCIGSAFMYKPAFPQTPSMFICGNDDEAKKTVSQILAAFGFEAEDMGKVEAARAIEPLCILWCIPGMTKGSWNHAFKLLKN